MTILESILEFIYRGKIVVIQNRLENRCKISSGGASTTILERDSDSNLI
jgi:hypothetical protein